MPTTVEILAAPARILGRRFYHVALYFEVDGTPKAISKRPFGWQVQSLSEFVDGRQIESIFLISPLEAGEIQSRVEKQSLIDHYSVFSDNCEHALFRLIGLPTKSPQLRHAATNAACGAAFGLFLSMLDDGKSAKTLAVAGGGLGAYVPVGTLGELYGSFGLPVIPRPLVRGS